MKTLYDTIIREAVAEYMPKYDWRLYKAQLFQESSLNPNAVSKAGAVGIAQFMPGTWEQYSKSTGYENTDPTDPEASIYTGAYYMRYLIEEWVRPRPDADRKCLALASYNAGLGNILEAQKASGDSAAYRTIIAHLPEVTGEHARETIWYVKKILSYYNEMVTG